MKATSFDTNWAVEQFMTFLAQIQEAGHKDLLVKSKVVKKS